jgi:hypothetical protein
MKLFGPQLNLVLAWLWIVAGFVGGLVLGLKFHREDWLGGYASFRRRLYRLGHISFFGLALVNLMFYFTVRVVAFNGCTGAAASWAFIVGALAMPACCFIMAHWPQARLLFALPVVSLLAGGLITLWEVIHP